MYRVTETTGITTVYADGRSEPGASETVHECELNIVVNQGNLARLVCMRSDLNYLVMGFLFTERIIDSPGEITLMNIPPYGNTAKVLLNRLVEMQPVPRTDLSCCTGNRILMDAVRKRQPGKVMDHSNWAPEDIFRLAGRFQERMPVHLSTESSHSCMLMHRSEILYACEDIGRHNALDKAVGYALLNNVPLSECVVYTSGRVPRDMVEKAISAGIPVLASKATPTAESVSLASEYGQTLICRVWKDSFEIFTREITKQSHSQTFL